MLKINGDVRNVRIRSGSWVIGFEFYWSNGGSSGWLGGTDQGFTMNPRIHVIPGISGSGSPTVGLGFEIHFQNLVFGQFLKVWDLDFGFINAKSRIRNCRPLEQTVQKPKTAEAPAGCYSSTGARVTGLMRSNLSGFVSSPYLDHTV